MWVIIAGALHNLLSMPYPTAMWPPDGICAGVFSGCVVGARGLAAIYSTDDDISIGCSCGHYMIVSCAYHFYCFVVFVMCAASAAKDRDGRW